MHRDRFDLWSETYDESILRDDAKGVFPFAGYKKAQEALFDSMRENVTHEMLDVGIGTGEFSARVAGLGASVTGIDFSKEMLEAAKRKIPGVQTLLHDLHKGLPGALVGRTFDGIVCAYSLHHFPDEQKIRLIRALFAMLNPGGLLAIGDISFENQATREACMRSNRDAWDSDEFYCAYDEMRSRIGIPSEYTQISFCAGILTIRKPQMLLFSYGGTLVQETSQLYERGFKALLANAKSNPSSRTVQEISTCFDQTLKMASDIRRKSHADISKTILLRALFDRLGIRFALTPLEMESVFYENMYQGRISEGVSALLALLRAKGIRTGIVCNTGYSGEVLAIHLRSALAEHRFEMIITSGDSFYRKPSPALFEIALQKANLSPEEIWFCGDNFAEDIKGAEATGMCPVWVTAKAVDQIAPARLLIARWDELACLFAEPELSF